MQVRSIYRHARISAFKAREVTREIQGLPVQKALDLLAFTPKKAAALVAKTLKSAVANAENNHNARSESLVVQEAVIGEGPTIKRFRPKARGSAGPIRKRTSHIRIIVSDEVEVPSRSKTPKARAGRKAAPATKAAKSSKTTKTTKTARSGKAAKSAAPAAGPAEETKKD